MLLWSIDWLPSQATISSLENGSVAWQVVKNVWKSIFLPLAKDRQQPFKKYRWCVLLVLNDEWWCTGYDGRCGCLMVVAFVRVRIKESDFNIRFLGDKEEGAEESGWRMPIGMVSNDYQLLSYLYSILQKVESLWLTFNIRWIGETETLFNSTNNNISSPFPPTFLQFLLSIANHSASWSWIALFQSSCNHFQLI